VYSLADLREGVTNPRKVVPEMARRLRGPYLATVGRLRDRRTLDFMAADWDTLVILDGCRHDLFAATNTLPGDLRRVVSKETGTDEFLEANVAGREFPDTVYLTANPHLHFVDAGFHAVERLWETAWDDDLDTVPPGPAVDAAIEAHECYPDKRVVLHAIQPHHPFIGETGRALDAEIDSRGFLEDGASIYHHLAAGRVEHDRVWRAYRENLALALAEVERLFEAEAVDGRVIVTSDHGNGFGEWSVYGHGCPRIPAVVDVPWLVADRGDRRAITPGTADARTLDIDAVGDGVVETRLAELGYR
jgi:hypothetical protein